MVKPLCGYEVLWYQYHSVIMSIQALAVLWCRMIHVTTTMWLHLENRPPF